jgi:hypothetical protein
VCTAVGLEYRRPSQEGEARNHGLYMRLKMGVSNVDVDDDEAAADRNLEPACSDLRKSKSRGV